MPEPTLTYSHSDLRVDFRRFFRAAQVCHGPLHNPKENTMASKVKVKIERTKVIDALKTRLTELEAGGGEVQLAPEVEKLIEEMEKAIPKLRAGVPACSTSRGDTGWALSGMWEAWETVRYGNDDCGSKPAPSREQMIDRIRKQIKLLELSSQEVVEVGVDDDLYELL